jgi:hypothetical protein
MDNYQLVVKAQSNIVDLRTLYVRMLGDKMKMDKFFTMYLDKFEKKMDPENTKTPIWDLYKKKLKEYDSLSQSIKAAEYFMKKLSHV